jgi:predicted nucleotidyltransferase
LAEVIDPKAKAFVIQLIRNYFPKVEILAFGSRTDGSARRYSDLDIALRSNEKISSADWISLESELEESDLPFKVDLLDFENLSEDFKKIIQKKCVKW